MLTAADLAAMPAAGCAAAAVWAWSTPRPVLLRLRGALAPSRRTAQGRLARHPAGPTDPLGALGALRTFRGLRALRQRRHRVRMRRAAVIELCDGIGAELAAGRTPDAALAASAAVLDPEVAVDLLGTTAYSAPGSAPAWSNVDGPALLERAAARPGAQGLRLLAACWRIGAERGATFASVVDGLAEALREEEAQRAEIASQLAGPRTTARLLAGLPLLGLAMAAALGARPLAFLCGTVPGAACLVLGLGLDLLGLWWTGRIAAAAERPA